MNATWCNVRRCWLVIDPTNPGSVLAVGRSKAEAEDAARERREWEMRREADRAAQ